MPTAVISTTYNDTYLWYLPLTTWVWNKLGVDVVCFMPTPNAEEWGKINVVQKLSNAQLHFFDCPEHKKPTYSQCSRLYGACLDLPEDEVLISSDIDMLVFSDVVCQANGDKITSYGFDLTPEEQLPMCYATAKVGTWRRIMGIDGRSYQQCLDDLLGHEEMQDMRANLWCRDQETLSSKVFATKDWFLVPRAKPGTQFADKRYDRDDAYILDRLSPDTIDYHMNRPGYEDGNFSVILQVLQYHYPNENFQWLIDYNEEYKKLL